VQIRGVHLNQHTIPPTYAERNAWESSLQITGAAPDCLLLLADTFSFPSEDFLKGLDRNFPQTIKLGGLASGMEQAETACLLLNETVYQSGVVSLALSGNIKVDTIVAQGCRPIGEPMFANATHENLILELDGKVPRDVLTELYATLSRADRKLFTDALFIGIAMEKQRERYQAGDFLVRTILGLDPRSGALWVNSHVPTHSVVQLHLRDAQTSSYDLEQLLKRYRAAPESGQAACALLLSCLGRGAQLYGHPDHDSNAFKQYIGDVPLGGFFGNGEIGPVHGATHLHGYTSVFGIFRQKE
jgi:small ligand-binding sensory domain FIST